MLPSKAGRYKGRPVNWGADKSKNDALEWACDFSLHAYWDGTKWVSPSGDEITGHFYPVKANGEINETTAKNLQESIGWDGTPRHLNDGDFSQYEVQLVLDFEEYKGVKRLKVQWINPGDSTPSRKVTKADAESVRSLETLFGAKLRAAGLVKQSGNAKAQANGKPNDTELAKRAAWTAFKEKYHDANDTDRADLWRAALKDYFNGKPVESIAAIEWQYFARDGFVMPPVGAAKGAATDDIPF
jgi:hypothetical protein